MHVQFVFSDFQDVDTMSTYRDLHGMLKTATDAMKYKNEQGPNHRYPEKIFSETDVKSLYLARSVIQEFDLIVQRGKLLELTDQGISMLNVHPLSNL